MPDLEYYGLGAQDAELREAMDSIVAAHNEANPDFRVRYGPSYDEDEEEEDRLPADQAYWALEDESADNFHMYVVYDDQAYVRFDTGSSKDVLIHAVIDAMQACLLRDGFTDSILLEA